METMLISEKNMSKKYSDSLDFQQVKLIAYTQPNLDLVCDDSIEFSNIKDMQDLVAFCARVSNPSNQFNMETADKLIKYLINNQHWSPLEMVSMCLEINTTRDIARQLLRHRSFSFQEFSQRYADPTKELDFVFRETRLQDTKNRQNSIEIDDEELDIWWHEQQEQVINLVRSIYKRAIQKGIAKEQARAILPEGNTVSRLYMNGTVRSWVHFIQLRSGNGTQKEHMMIARLCAEVIAKAFPMMLELTNTDK